MCIRFPAAVAFEACRDCDTVIQAMGLSLHAVASRRIGTRTVGVPFIPMHFCGQLP